MTDVPAPGPAWPDDAAPVPSRRILLLHPDDNVLVVVATVAAGDPLPVGGGTVPAREGVTVGHKVARIALEPGDKVVKYGAPIGSMTAAAAPGDWIHMHNMRSDYIAAHGRADWGGA